MHCVNTVQTIKAELDNANPCVTVWNDTAQHLLQGIQSAGAAQASSRLADVSERLSYLNRVCISHLEQVESAIGGDIAQRVWICCFFYNKVASCDLDCHALLNADWKPTFSTNPSHYRHYRPLPPIRLTSWTLDCSVVFLFSSFHYSFCSISYCRLNWLYVIFWSHVKYFTFDLIWFHQSYYWCWWELWEYSIHPCLSVCPQDRTKMAKTTITKLATAIVRHEPWLPI